MLTMAAAHMFELSAASGGTHSVVQSLCGLGLARPALLGISGFCPALSSYCGQICL